MLLELATSRPSVLASAGLGDDPVSYAWFQILLTVSRWQRTVVALMDILTFLDSGSEASKATCRLAASWTVDQRVWQRFISKIRYDCRRRSVSMVHLDTVFITAGLRNHERQKTFPEPESVNEVNL
jgi:hypothetical protein